MKFKLKIIGVFFLGAMVFSACETGIESQIAEEEIKDAMREQQEAWNQGDIEAFMSYYLESEDINFVTSKGLVKGHSTLLSRYQRSYPDRESMGDLEFDFLDFKSIDANYAMLVGKWTLYREHDAPGGYFSFLWQKTSEGWKIIHDHTS